jgi:hypothetical protein
MRLRLSVVRGSESAASPSVPADDLWGDPASPRAKRAALDLEGVRYSIEFPLVPGHSILETGSRG